MGDEDSGRPNKEVLNYTILNYVNFYGEAKQTFKTPDHISKYKRGLSLKEGYYGQIWRNAWVPGLDKWEERGKDFRVCQNIGRGILFTGTDIWKDYSVSSKIILQSLSSGGLASRVQGLKRYYTFELNKNNIGLFRNVKESQESLDIPKEIPVKVRKFIKNFRSSGGEYSRQMTGHSSMTLDAYTHITSPIRRLVDLLNIMILQDTLGLYTMSSEALGFYNNWIYQICFKK